MLTLVIGNHNYSSWSLRAWFFLRASGLDFELRRIPMFTGDWADAVARCGAAGRVPVLLDDELIVWDSTAIMAHVCERHPGALGWPEDLPARALARSIAGEMHSGFMAIRDELPQNIRARHRLAQSDLSADCGSQIGRIEEIWTLCASRYAAYGPWLFGDLCIADVMFAPVALRFRTYGIEVSEPARRFVEAVTTNPLIREWCALAAEETESIPFIDDLVPVKESPLTLG